MKKHFGFTVIELLVAVAVAAIILALGVPSFTNVIKNNRLSTQANSIITAIAIARSEAAKLGQSVVLTATDGSDGNNEWGPGWKVTNTGGTTTYLTQEALQGSSTLDSEGDFTTFTFSPSGWVDNADVFDLCDDRTGETGRQITLTATGRVSVANLTCD